MKPSKKRQADMMATARALWVHHSRESGQSTMPFVYALGHHGELLIYSEFGVPSRQMADLLVAKFGGVNPFAAAAAADEAERARIDVADEDGWLGIK